MPLDFIHIAILVACAILAIPKLRAHAFSLIQTVIAHGVTLGQSVLAHAGSVTGATPTVVKTTVPPTTPPA